MDTHTSQLERMRTSLHDAFSKRLPAGLTPTAEGRLQQTLQHYVREVGRAKGHIEEQEVLRLSYDSMVNWYRRHPSELAGKPTAVAPDDFMQYEVSDPLSLFSTLQQETTSVVTKPTVAAAAATDATFVAAAAATDATFVAAAAAAAPLPPELQSIDTRIIVKKETVQAKDLLQRQEDVVKYRESEYNLILNSKDRNWLVNTKENRYHFSVQLDSASIPSSQNPQITIHNRFRNIVRVEFVKAILPVEGLDVVLTRDCSDATPETSFTSALGLPYINVTLDEMTANNIGTDTHIDKSLAICQYDAAWKPDHVSTTSLTSRGYTLFFPKLMKAQRIYAPTPLSSFQRLSFEILTPENTLLSKSADSFAVGGIFFGQTRTLSCYATADYIFVQTKEWFPLWAFSRLDRVTLAGLIFYSATPTSEAGFRVLADWLARPEGHIVVGIGHTYTGGAAPLTDVADGANGCGYANYIILQNRLSNPAIDGTCAVELFTGSDPTETTMVTELASFPADLQKGGILNLSRQVQLVLRVITREMDSATNIRPDNI